MAPHESPVSLALRLPPPPPPVLRSTVSSTEDNAIEGSPLAEARSFAAQAIPVLQGVPAFQQLPTATQGAIIRDLGVIQQSLGDHARSAHALETPLDQRRSRPSMSAEGYGDVNPKVTSNAAAGAADNTANESDAQMNVNPAQPAATQTLAARAGALVDEIDFPAFVAGLVHNTFDAIVNASIRQMEAFASLVSAVAKDVEQFTAENITSNHARDWLAQQFPRDLMLELPASTGAGEPRLRARNSGSPEDESQSPPWMANFALEGEPLTDDLIEEQLVPAARKKLGEDRLQMLATMVLLGMNRVNVKDGTISAKVRFRAAARDSAAVMYATSSDPGSDSWGARGSSVYAGHATMVSTVGVNVQSDTELKAELFGEVKINFVSETLPLDRFVDQAHLTLLQRHARPAGRPTPAPAQPTGTDAAPSTTPPSLMTPPAQVPATGGR